MTAPSREWLLARLVGLGNELTDEALLGLAAVAEAFAAPRERRRDLSPGALALEQAARDTGTVLALVSNPDAFPIGRALAAVASEVDRATRLHGRAFPGGWGPAGRREDVEAMLRAKDRCDAAQAAGGATLRDVLEEEVAEVWAEEAGSVEQWRELAQVAAVCVRAMMTEVR